MARKSFFHLSESKYPHVELEKDAWNDYGYTTLYNANLFLAPSNRISLGNVKILNVDAGIHDTQLPSKFHQLPSNCISLGQDMEYYRELSYLDRDIQENILVGLNDVAYENSLAAPYTHHPGFVMSLLRFSEAEKAYREAKQHLLDGKSVIDNDATGKKYTFTFSCRLNNAASDHVVAFDFDPLSPLPSRIHAIIGRNGTGKTQFLAKFANAISGVDLEEGAGVFEPDRPAFSKIIAISYSAFDSFKKPPRKPMPEDRTFSYQYCGLQDSEGVLSLPDSGKFDELITLIKDKKRLELWESLMDNLASDFYSKKGEDSFKFEIMKSYSSGQTILIYIITNVIAHIENEALLLFDEPETHLHPNLVANLVAVVYSLLENFNSYAIISTHSPLILQEIPSQYVRVFKRLGEIAIVQRLGKECFGENLSTISEEIFQVQEAPSSYRRVLENLSRSYTYDTILQMFNDKLSLSAKIYLKSISST